MKFRSERGNTMVEVAMFLPALMTLLVGMFQIAQITYTYYTLRKAVYAVATYLSTQQ
jgi:Flp pilus assembly protein TadG